MKKDTEKKETESENKVLYMPIFMCIGLSVGLAIGSATNNMPVFMCIGLSIGMSIGIVLDRINRKKDESKDEKDNETK